MQNEIIEQLSIHKGGTHITSAWIKGLYKGNITVLSETIASLPKSSNSLYAKNFIKLAKMRKYKPNNKILIQLQDLNFMNDYEYVYNFYKIKAIKKQTVLVLKDFFSLTSSMIKLMRWGKRPGESLKLDHIFFTGLANIWKGYAKEFIGETNYFKDKICISLNHLTESLSYRQKKAKEFEKQNCDECFKYFASKPSHDLSIKVRDEVNGKLPSYQKRIEQMFDDKILSIKYLSYIFDEEIVSLNKRIFSDILDIEEIINDKRLKS